MARHSAFDEIKICTGYELDGKKVHYYDLDSYQLGRVTPVYETMPGWKSDIRDIRQFADLPAEAKAYVERIEELVGVKIGWVTNGPEREAIMAR